jgi:hypothetical protein
MPTDVNSVSAPPTKSRTAGSRDQTMPSGPDCIGRSGLHRPSDRVDLLPRGLAGWKSGGRLIRYDRSRARAHPVGAYRRAAHHQDAAAGPAGPACRKQRAGQVCIPRHRDPIHRHQNHVTSTPVRRIHPRDRHHGDRHPRATVGTSRPDQRTTRRISSRSGAGPMRLSGVLPSALIRSSPYAPARLSARGQGSHGDV